eukprot:TRINITY_DN48618_c0_g1_i1.p1 TRINITY_DN48618_c0_g1~~TRINITY_DN48618_c0_g1_i1.p1  ORF type:complete len:722 (-),score=74.63 TRINITY_DN48618_c0_g1_i1:151-2316(-)
MENQEDGPSFSAKSIEKESMENVLGTERTLDGPYIGERFTEDSVPEVDVACAKQVQHMLRALEERLLQSNHSITRRIETLIATVEIQHACLKRAMIDALRTSMSEPEALDGSDDNSIIDHRRASCEAAAAAVRRIFDRKMSDETRATQSEHGEGAQGLCSFHSYDSHSSGMINSPRDVRKPSLRAGELRRLLSVPAMSLSSHSEEPGRQETSDDATPTRSPERENRRQRRYATSISEGQLVERSSGRGTRGGSSKRRQPALVVPPGMNEIGDIEVDLGMESGEQEADGGEDASCSSVSENADDDAISIARVVGEPRRVSNMENVRKVQEEELLSGSGLTFDQSSSPVQQSAPSFAGSSLATSGKPNPVIGGMQSRYIPHYVLQWYTVLSVRSSCMLHWYGRIAPMLLLALLVYFVYASTLQLTFLYSRLSWASYTLGSLLGLTALRFDNIDALIGSGNAALDRYAKSQGFFNEWLRVSTKLFVIIAGIWALTISSWGLVLWFMDDGRYHDDAACESTLACFVPRLLSFLTLALGSSLFAAITYCQLHVCCCLEIMVDKFCIRFFEKPDLEAAVLEWNVLQALLRRSANSVDMCLVCTQTAVLFALALSSAEYFAGDGVPSGSLGTLWILSQIPGVILAFLALFRSAAVTEKCIRMPSLMNTVRFEGSPINHDRQYVVQFLEQSAAGFYVKGVRLTSFMVLKLAYFAGVVVFAFLTRIKSSS